MSAGQRWAILIGILVGLGLFALVVFLGQHPDLRPGCMPHRPSVSCTTSPAPTR